MPKTAKDPKCGKNGAAVVWHPIEKKYYAGFAGNEDYPMAVFNAAGKRISDENLTCMKDLRGLWYNPKLKNIWGNGYYDIGWFNYKLNSKGIPVENEIYAEGMNQPEEHSIGVFNATTNNVYFQDFGEIIVYDADAMQEEDSTIRIYLGYTRAVESSDDFEDFNYFLDNYNTNVLIYTGIRKAEFGFLNKTKNQVELYNRKTGLMTQKLKLPYDLKISSMFNFSYSNGIYWVFNTDTRKWTGYK
jgi:hypothetical protein